MNRTKLLLGIRRMISKSLSTKFSLIYSSDNNEVPDYIAGDLLILLTMYERDIYNHYINNEPILLN